MKLIISVILIAALTASVFTQNNNITNTLGTGGLFTIKDNTNIYLSLSQSNGTVNINRNLNLRNTESSTVGVINCNGIPFLHSYGTANTFMGIYSGNFSMTGTYNTAVGYYSMYKNATGSENSAFGNYSLYLNSSGSQNSAFGSNSLYNNTTGSRNSAFGSYSLYSNTAGFDNSAFGFRSLYSNNTGSGNSAFGSNSLEFNIGSNNSAFGMYSLGLNTTGSNNSAFGMGSLSNNTTGSCNSVFGAYALNTNITGSRNTIFGYLAGGFVWGDRNTAFGDSALYTPLGLAHNNTAIGQNAQVPYYHTPNQIRIGSFDISYAGIQVPWTITSDRRWKQNITHSKLSLDFISKLNPVSYTRTNNINATTEFGFIGQEVDSLLKEFKVDNPGMITVSDRGFYELRYNDLIAPMVRAIQVLKAENDELKKSNEKLNGEIEILKSLKEKVGILEKIISAIALEKEMSTIGRK